MNESMTQGVELMFTGMGIVFLFLVMLIGVVKLTAFCVDKFFSEAQEVSTSGVLSKAPANNNNTAAVTAAITAAVHQHRAK